MGLKLKVLAGTYRPWLGLPRLLFPLQSTHTSISKFLKGKFVLLPRAFALPVSTLQDSLTTDTPSLGLSSGVSLPERSCPS